MPKPVYMVCCQSGAEDERSKLASLFNIYDRIEIHDSPKRNGSGLPGFMASIPLRIVAAWSADKREDFGVPFEARVTLTTPPDSKKNVIYEGEFTFENEKPRHRFTFDVLGFIVHGPGDLVAECGIRKKGTQRWLRQKYIIEVLKQSSR